MSLDLNKLLVEISTIKNEILAESKRAIKKQVPKSLIVRNEIRDNLVKLYNSFTNTLADCWLKLSEAQRHDFKQTFLLIRDKIVRSFQSLGVRYRVPTSIVENINTQILDDEDISEEDTMALTINEFFNLASKLLPVQFDGSFDKLQSFLDSLTLLQANSDGHNDRAIAFVKTRLTGKARDLITDTMTLDDIFVSLKNNIKGESSKIISAKLLSLRQNIKDTNAFATEIESLANMLKRAYISEGVPHAVSETYATDTTVKALSRNATSERTRLIMEAGTFTTVQEAITKLVSITNETNNNASVLYAKPFRPYNNSNNFSNQYRGPQNRRPVSNNGQHRNYGRHSSNYPKRHFRSNSRRYTNNNNSSERHVRVCQGENTNSSGNESFPQH